MREKWFQLDWCRGDVMCVFRREKGKKERRKRQLKGGRLRVAQKKTDFE
jgi:hypothetical protein